MFDVSRWFGNHFSSYLHLEIPQGQPEIGVRVCSIFNRQLCRESGSNYEGKHAKEREHDNSTHEVLGPRVLLQESAVSREILRWCLWGMPLLAWQSAFFCLSSSMRNYPRRGAGFFSSIVYSVVIGMPSAVLLNLVGFRYTERFPRLILLFNSMVLLVTATVGPLVAGLVFLAVGFEKSSEYWHRVQRFVADLLRHFAYRGLGCFLVRDHAAQAAICHSRSENKASRAGTRLQAAG